MKIRVLFVVFLLAAGFGLLRTQLPAAASPAAQQAVPSPTPGPDGQIRYIIQAGDTCAQIARMFSVSVEYIRTINLLDETCSLKEGNTLLLGIGGPSSTTPSAGPTVTPSATPTPAPGASGTADVCVLVYDDINGDALRQTTESAIAAAAVSLTSQEGTYSQSLTTVINPDPEAYQGICFTTVPPGMYNVSGAAPDGYNPTTEMAYALEVFPGDSIFVDFGAQSQTAPGAKNPAGSSPLLGIIGALFVLSGIGLGVYTWRMARK